MIAKQLNYDTAQLRLEITHGSTIVHQAISSILRGLQWQLIQYISTTQKDELFNGIPTRRALPIGLQDRGSVV